MRTILLSATLMSVLPAGASAAETLTAGAPAYPVTMAALPAPVRDLLERRHGEMADVGGPFSGWCVRAPGSFSARLVRAEVRPDEVRIRFERSGGRAGPRGQSAVFRKDGADWIEVGQASPPSLRIMQYTGEPRRFTTDAATVLPQLLEPGRF